jgi:mono/diheme cytochrome c family protein
MILFPACSGTGETSDDTAITPEMVETIDDVMALVGDTVSGETIYFDNCARCHLDDGSGDKGPSLIFHIPKHSDEYFVQLVINGRGNMPGFPDFVEQDISDLISYLRETFGDQD